MIHPIVILLVFIMAGCSEPPAVKFISDKTETLREEKFEILYPHDWDVSGTEDTISPEKKCVYHLTHPENKKCRITIERSVVPAQGDGTLLPFNKLAAKKIRDLKNQFSSSGYRDFSFYTNETTFTGRSATQLAIKGSKKDVTRELTAYMIIHNDYFYIISYEWFSDWNLQARSHMKAAVASFRLIH